MSLGYCIPDLIAAGKIPPAHAAELRTLYDELVTQHEARLGRPAAEALATQQAVDAWEKGIKAARRQRLLNLNRQAQILHDARTGFREARADGPVSPAALAAVLAWDRRASYANVEYVTREVKQTALGQLYDILAKHRADLIGNIRNKDDLNDLVREAHGQDTGNLNARELADAWQQVTEYLRQRFNAAGGAIGKLASWGMAQSHDAMRVGAVSAEDWIDALIPMLDRARMTDRNTLQPMGDAQLRVMLRGVYDSIVSDGWIGREPGAGGAGMLANRRSEQRVLHFKDADSWLAYNDRFGQATPFEAMMGHIATMARDIGMMEVLGPNPAATVKWMKDVAMKEAAERGTKGDRDAAAKAGDKIDKIWSVLNGEANRPVSQTGAQIGAALRNWQAATKLGSAVVGSMSDVATAALTRHYNGLSSMTQLPDMVKLLAQPEAAAQLRRAGFISEEFIGHVSGAGRTQIEDLDGGRLAGGMPMREKMARRANELTRRMADTTLRASGLNAWTLAGREATAKEFAGTFADEAGKAFGDLDPALRGFFQRYGMGEREWDAVRAVQPDMANGYAKILPSMIPDEAVRRRVLQAQLTEIDFAIPTGGVRQRTLLAGNRPGTIMGELARTGFQFKMFPVTVMSMHLLRMLDQPGGWNKAAYAAKFLGGTTLMGALSYQLSSIVKGQDPARMDSRDFWWRATLKGGGLGVFGDVVNSSNNQFGQDIGDIMAGPAFGTAQEVASLAWGKVHTDDDGNKVRVHDVARFLQRETPGGSLWMVRSAYQRLLLDQLKEMQGEGYVQSYAALERRAKDDGSAYWWRPGERLPGRGPNLGNAIAAENPDN